MAMTQALQAQDRNKTRRAARAISRVADRIENSAKLRRAVKAAIKAMGLPAPK